MLVRNATPLAQPLSGFITQALRPGATTLTPLRSPGLRASGTSSAYFDGHNPGPHTAKVARRKLANKLVGVLYGCLAHQTPYDDLRAWPRLVEEIAA